MAKFIAYWLLAIGLILLSRDHPILEGLFIGFGVGSVCNTLFRWLEPNQE